MALLGIKDELGVILSLKKKMAQPEGYHYFGAEDFVLQHGTLYEPSALPRGVLLGRPKSCYCNSIAMAVLRGWKYVEGFGTINMSDGEVFPFSIPHAWNVDGMGRVVDTTWEPGVAVEYIGVEFSYRRADYATWHDDATVLDNPRSRWAIFRQPWTGEDYSKVWPESPMLKHLLQVKGSKQMRRRVE